MSGPFQWLKERPAGAARAAGLASLFAGLVYGSAVIAANLATLPAGPVTRLPVNLVGTFGSWPTAIAAAAFLAGGIGLRLTHAWGRYVTLTAACAWAFCTLLARLALGSFLFGPNLALNVAVVAALLLLAGTAQAAADPPPSPRGKRFVRALAGLFTGGTVLLVLVYAALLWHLASRDPRPFIVPAVLVLKPLSEDSFPVPAAPRTFAGVRLLVPRSYSYVQSACEPWGPRTMLMVDRARAVHLEVSDLTQYDSLAEELPLLGGLKGFDYGARYARERAGLLIVMAKAEMPPNEIEELDLPEWRGFRYWYQTMGDDVHTYALWHRATGRPFELAFYVPRGHRDRSIMDAVAGSIRIDDVRKTGDDWYREGLALGDTGRHQDARFTLALAVQADCSDMRYRLALGRETFASGAYADVQTDIREVIRQQPDNKAASDLAERAAREMDRLRLEKAGARTDGAVDPGTR